MKRVIQNWNFIRFVRLILGITIIIQGIQSHEMMIILAGSLFGLMAVLNIGCMGGNCAVPVKSNQHNHKSNTDEREIEFEEVV